MRAAAAGRRATRRRVCLLSAVWALLLSAVVANGGHAFDASTPCGPIREIRFGLAAHDVDGLWSGASKEKGPDLTAEVIFNRALFRFFSTTAYPNVGASINTRGDTSMVYGGILLQWEPTEALFFATGVGLAVHDGKRDTDALDRKSLGSQVLFRIPIEIGYAVSRHHRVALAFDHISNAYLASPNEGMDTIGLKYGYQF